MPISVGAGGVWKAVVGQWVGAGGVWKFGAVSVGASGVWKASSAPGYSGTMTVTDTINGSGNGFLAGSTFSPSIDGTGKTIAACYETYSAFFNTNTVLQISGFSSNPGSTYFTTAILNGISRTSAAASFGYSSGTATWTWAPVGALTAGAGRTLSYS